MYRQGDVLLRKVNTLPRKARKIKTDTILEGEVTGHAHRIEQGSIFLLSGSEDSMFVQVNPGGRLVHDEHGPIDLEPGIYEVVRQREYNPEHPEIDWWVED